MHPVHPTHVALSWQTLRDLVSLTKPRVTSLVLLTAGGGLWLAPTGVRPWSSGLFLLATAAVVGSANALNCWIERDSDRLMQRTRKRPLPAGRLPSGWALAFGLTLGLLSLPVLALAANLLTAWLGALALAGYVWIYTPLKRLTPAALYVGAIPGAMPPLMGWTAATGRIDAVGLTLFGILFVWQIPHFLAIALFRCPEYERAGLRVLPSVVGTRGTRHRLLVWSLVLLVVSTLPTALGVTGMRYLAVACVLGGGLVAWAVQGLRATSDVRWARRYFAGTLLHLTVLVIVLVADFSAP